MTRPPWLTPAVLEAWRADAGVNVNCLGGGPEDYTQADKVLALIREVKRLEAENSRLFDAIRLALSDLRVALEVGGGVGQTIVQLRAALPAPEAGGEAGAIESRCRGSFHAAPLRVTAAPRSR